MFILVVAATSNEVNSTIEWIQKGKAAIGENKVDVLISGVGSTATTYALTRQFCLQKPDLVIQAGIGGSFNSKYPPVSTVIVKDEVFADLGAFSDDGFDDMFDLGLTAADEQPFSNGALVNTEIDRWASLALPFVKGATINCISSTERQIAAIQQKYNPDVESMEGAALHYTCILEQVPFLQLRTVSNFVGVRDKNEWKFKESIAELNFKLQEILAFILTPTHN